jgi:DNA topoisomerase-3
MPTIIITEKPDQKRQIEAAIGQSLGEIIAAQGHLLRLQFPSEVNPAWATWNDDLLMPPGGRYPFCPDGGGGKAPRLSALKSALKRATLVVIATDPDREGQLIGQEILDYFGYKGPVKRAIYNAVDPVTLTAAFANLKDNKLYEPLYAAGVARQQGDQIFNLTLTRVASNNLRAPTPLGARPPRPIGIGRVKTPTMGIVCRRELEIKAFVAKTYYVIGMTIKGSAGEATLWHAPRDDEMILDKTRADAIASSARGYRGPIAVQVARKTRTPPRPMDMVQLQIRASGLFGWTAAKTLEIAQALYETHQITTYPRAESRYLPEAMIPDAPRLLSALKAIPAYKPYPLTQPVIRKGKSGVWSDAGLAGSPHHAIIPNINCPGSIAAAASKLNADEHKLFDLIAKAFLAAIGEEWVYEQTTLTIDVTTPPPTPVRFTCIGNVTLSAGYRAILGHEDDDDDVALPKFHDKDPVVATKADVATKQTEPPKRYTEGTLIKAMATAWQFVDDAVERDRLKEAKGIGTTATRDQIIKTLFTQEFFVTVKKFIEPTDAALKLYAVLMKVAPALLDPGATARMEARLDDVAAGKATADAVIQEIAAQAQKTIPVLVTAGKTIKIAALQRAHSGTLPKPKFGKGRKAYGKTAYGKAAYPAKAAVAATPTKAAPPAKPSARRSAKSPAATIPPATAKPTAASPNNVTTALSVPGIALKVSYQEKDAAKALGARFDGKSRLWYCPPGVDPDLFKQNGWL